MRWCCPGFHGHFEKAGKRLFCIFADTTGSTPCFVLQFRANERQIDINSPEPISLIGEIVISFCPWCGRNLLKFYRKRIDELARNELRIPL